MIAACNALVGFDDLERVGAIADDAGGDASGDPSETGVETPLVTDSARCNPNAPFEPPVPATELDGDAQSAGAAVMTEDELEIFYRRFDGDAGAFRHGRRFDASAPWDPANIATEETLSPAAVRGFSITQRGLKLYYGGSDYRNHVATRTRTSESFEASTLYFEDVLKDLFAVADDEIVYASYQPDTLAAEHVIVRAANPILAAESFQTFEYGHPPGAVDSNPILNPSQTRLYAKRSRAGLRGDLPRDARDEDRGVQPCDTRRRAELSRARDHDVGRGRRLRSAPRAKQEDLPSAPAALITRHPRAVSGTSRAHTSPPRAPRSRWFRPIDSSCTARTVSLSWDNRVARSATSRAAPNGALIEGRSARNIRSVPEASRSEEKKISSSSDERMAFRFGARATIICVGEFRAAGVAPAAAGRASRDVRMRRHSAAHRVQQADGDAGEHAELDLRVVTKKVLREPAQVGQVELARRAKLAGPPSIERHELVAEEDPLRLAGHPPELERALALRDDVDDELEPDGDERQLELELQGRAIAFADHAVDHRDAARVAFDVLDEPPHR